MIINIDNKHLVGYDKDTKTFASEISTLSCKYPEIYKFCREGARIYLKNPKTGNQVGFTRFKVDTDFGGEDIYGWWYRGSHKGQMVKFLIIND